MSRTANLSVLGLYNWDNTIFEYFHIPDELELDTLTENLLSELAELEVLYSNPVVMKGLIGVWSNKQLPIWKKLYETTQYEYNPIENYNRTETSNDSGSKNYTNSGSDTVTGNTGTTNSGSDTISKNGSETLSGSDTLAGQSLKTNGGTDSNLHSIASYDSATLVDQYSDTTNYGKTESESHSDTTTYGKVNTTSDTETIQYGKRESTNNSSTTSYGKTETESNSGTHSMNAHGNIGVTTTQNMIRQEREIDKLNLYDYIIDEFKMRFCILVY